MRGSIPNSAGAASGAVSKAVSHLFHGPPLTPVIKLKIDRLSAEAAAKRLYQSIGRQLGWTEAQRIFGALAMPPPKKEMEEIRNCCLLQTYIQHRWPVEKLARHLVELNKTLLPQIRYGSRGGAGGNPITQKGLEKQLWRLLEKRPRKQTSPLLRSLIEEANKLPKRGRGAPRKQMRSD
jgi:hypothetical protein